MLISCRLSQFTQYKISNKIINIRSLNSWDKKSVGEDKSVTKQGVMWG